MAKKDSNTAPTEDKPKRKMLTPAERVAKLEAELAAARERAAKRADSKNAKLREKRDALVAKRDALTKQIEDIEWELGDEEVAAAASEDTES